MNKTTFAQQAKKTSFLSPSQGMLQRKCTCGNRTDSGGECAECAKKKSGLQRKLAIGASNDPLELEADRVADQVISTSVNPGVRNIAQSIQRYSGQPSGQIATVPNSVERVLASPGKPLDISLQKDMESRFGHDFSRVRVHLGPAAEQSARDVNANAYTFGHNIVFGADQFKPETHTGIRLLAHELTHVVQQSAPDGMRDCHSGEKLSFSPAGGVIWRQVRRGAAGGCGICMEDPRGEKAGGVAHAEIQEAFIATNPNIVGEYAVHVTEAGKPAPFIPEVDLAYEAIEHDQKIINIGEIKPLDDAGKQVEIAREKLRAYTHELKANPELGFDEVFRMRDAPPTPLPFFNPNNPPFCPLQLIHVRLTEPGIYQYYCEPPFSQLVRDPRCRCRQKDEEDTKEKVKEKEKEKEKDVPKSVDKPEQNEDIEKEKIPQKNPEIYGWPEVAGGLGAGAAAAAAAAAAYLRKRALEEAERRAAQLAWRRLAEAAAARRAAQAAGKGAAGKTVGKAVVYGEIAAAAALIIFYSDRVEAKPGPGVSALESLYRAMTTNGTPPSPEMKALIESDPLLKQLAEDAASGGDSSRLQEEMTRRMMELIRQDPNAFTPEDLEFLAEYCKTVKTAGKAPETVDQLRKAIDAVKAGKTGVSGSGGGKGGTEQKPKTEISTGDKGATTEKDEGEKGTAGQVGTPSPSASHKTPEERLVEGMASKEAGGPKFTAALKEKLLAAARAVTPPLTDKEVDDLLTRLESGTGKSEEEIVESVRKGVAALRTSKGGEASPAAPEPAEPGEKPEKTPGKVATDDVVKKAKQGKKDPVLEAKLEKKLGWIEAGWTYITGSTDIVFEHGRSFSANIIGRDKAGSLFFGSGRVTPRLVNGTWQLEIPAGIKLGGAAGHYGVTQKFSIPAFSGVGTGKKEKAPAD